MTWIKTIRMEDDEQLRNAILEERKLYPAEYATPVPSVFSGVENSIVGSHSLFPEVLFQAFSTFGALMSPELPLRRDQHEMIATMVSVTNRCFYLIESHAEFLRRVTLDEEMVAALRKDFRTAPISEPDKAMIEYVVKLTRDAT